LPASPLRWRYRQDFKVTPESAFPDHPQPAQRSHVLLGDDALIRVQVVNRLRVMAYCGPMSAIRPQPMGSLARRAMTVFRDQIEALALE